MAEPPATEHRHDGDARSEGSRGNSGNRGKQENQGSRSQGSENGEQGQSGGSGSRRRRRGGGGGGEPADKPRIGDSRPAAQDDGGGNRGGQTKSESGNADSGNDGGGNSGGQRRRSNRNRGGQQKQGGSKAESNQNSQSRDGGDGGGGQRKRRRGGRGRGRGNKAVQGGAGLNPIELDEATLAKRRGKERDGKPIGRYLMAVHVEGGVRHIAILEGRSLIEYYVSRPTDDATQIHGNVYAGRVQNVLPGMEAAFIDIATPKNAVLYHGDLQYDPKEFEGRGQPRIEQVLKARKMILCQVTKNPIAHKGARLTQEVSLPGRFVVLIPNSSTYGISKRLEDKERKRLRRILDEVKPKEHGVIVRTAAEDVTAEELQRDVSRLLNQWERIKELNGDANSPRLLYREPDLAVRLIREEFNKEYRGVVIDDRTLFEEVSGYVDTLTPALSDRIEHYDVEKEGLSLFERHHVHEQLHKALDTKVWLPSGGSLIIEHTEALTVIDVNTGKNVGKSNLEDTVFKNNLEAAKEVARQLRLRDIGGIIVIDFVDMESRKNRARVVDTFREALAQDKTRTQVYEISDLGLVEMTRKRIGEGLLESVSHTCPVCDGRGVELDSEVVGDL